MACERMDDRKNLYKILGVSRDASPAAIRSAYRRLARRLHPDTGGTEGGVLTFQDLQAAYETLSDAERRRRYDETLDQREPQRRPPAMWRLRIEPRNDLRRPLEAGCVSGEVLLSREEAAAGGLLPLEVPFAATCAGCAGTGGAVFDCARCLGEGRILQRLPLSVRIPRGVRDGAVFQIAVHDEGLRTILITVHVSPW